MINAITHDFRSLMCSRRKTYENTAGKGDNARQEHFLNVYRKNLNTQATLNFVVCNCFHYRGRCIILSSGEGFHSQ